MKSERGSLPEDVGTAHDNHRIKRYVAKLTINPARIYGIDHEIGSLERGKLADIVLWEPKFFGIKPEVVFKGGFPAWSVMGESNASLMTCEPLVYRPQWGAYGPARQGLSVTFMTQAGIDGGAADKWSLRKRLVATRNTRRLTKEDMLHNDATPSISVDPETYRVEVDGELCTCEPLQRVPLGALYVLK
jgi:urease subunit alpha